jgi:hypothetical protein
MQAPTSLLPITISQHPRLKSRECHAYPPTLEGGLYLGGANPPTVVRAL